MPKPMIRIHNAQTGEIIDREMTDDEYADYEIEQIKVAQEKQAKADAEAEAVEKRSSALAKLEALGLTVDDLEALAL